jgi:tRNA-dihydrouridine synthase
MIGRGAIADPWIFKQSKHFLETGEHLPEPSIEEKIQVCIEHLKLNVRHKDEKYGVQTFRKHYVGYLKGLPNIASVRSELMQLTRLDEVIERLEQYLNSVEQPL